MSKRGVLVKIAFFDCFSGVSGDMMLGALVDAGADPLALEEGINSLPIEPVKIRASKRVVMGIRSTDISVVCAPSQRVRNFAEVERLLTNSSLSPGIIERSLAAFWELAQAEAKVHGLPVEEVHFHEIGALDTIADIVGCSLALEQLAIGRIVASPLPWSGGSLAMSHGVYPLPAPATAELLREIPCYGVDADMELVTPTGAALLRVLSDGFGPIPHMTPSVIGYGAGKKERPNVPNLLRVVIGCDNQENSEQAIEQVGVIETEVDDMLPEHFSLLSERLAGSEVLDYYYTPIQMKKGRPGVLITLIVPPERLSPLVDILLAHTSTLGVRYWLAERSVLPRVIRKITTPWGMVHVKVAYGSLRPPKVSPEYEDCRQIALSYNLPLDVVYREVMSRALAEDGTTDARGCTRIDTDT